MPEQSGWYALLAIRDEMVDAYRADARPPVACPNDGEPLSTSPDGGLFCQFDGWQYSGGGASADM